MDLKENVQISSHPVLSCLDPITINQNISQAMSLGLSATFIHAKEPSEDC